MWTKSKSAALSLICTKILIGASIALAVALPFILSGGYQASVDLIDAAIAYQRLPAITIYAIFICAYACIAFALIALFSLNSLLRNIKKEFVFSPENIKCLRIISWCCFAIAIIMFCGWPFIHVVLIFVAAAAAFFGILMRVIKNVFEAAREIKDENDFTI